MSSASLRSNPRVICTVTNDLNYDQRMQRICRTLQQHGYEVVLVGRKLPHSQALAHQPFTQKRLSCLFHNGKLFYLEYNLRLFLFLMGSHVDIINAIDLDTILPCWFASALKRKKRVFDAHEYFPEVPEVVDRPVVQQIWRWIEQVAVPRFPSAYTVSGSLAELLNQKYGKRFSTIRNVPEWTQYEKSSSHQPCLLYQGALNKDRGLEHLLEAMQWIDCQLTIVGEGDLSQALRKKAEVIALSGKVTFLGYLRPQELKMITQQATIGLNLLENSCDSYYYSLANKFFDYIHADVPSINMAFPEYKRINKEFEVSVLLHELKPASIANAVNSLLTDKDFYQRLQGNCEKAKQLFNWEQEQQKLLRIYEEL